MSFRVLLLLAVLLLHTAQAGSVISLLQSSDSSLQHLPLIPANQSRDLPLVAATSLYSLLIAFFLTKIHSSQDEPQDIWQSIIRYVREIILFPSNGDVYTRGSYKPDLWLWLGGSLSLWITKFLTVPADIVYADKRIVPFYRVPSPLPGT